MNFNNYTLLINSHQFEKSNNFVYDDRLKIENNQFSSQKYELNSKVRYMFLKSSASTYFSLSTILDYLLLNDIEMIELILNLFGQNYVENNILTQNKEFKEVIENSRDCSRVEQTEGSKLIEPKITSILNVPLRKIEQLLFGKAEQNLNLKRRFSKLNLEFYDIKNYEESPLMKSVFKVLTDDASILGDNFSKYFIIRITNQNKEKASFRLFSSELCWLYLITDQEFLIKFLSKDKSFIDYKFIQIFCIPLWVKDDSKLREIVELVAKNEYRQEIKKQDSFGNKMFSEQVSLFYLLANKMNILLDIMEKEKQIPGVTNIIKFLKKDFSVEKNRKAARDNAMDLMIKKRYIYSAFFYLVADEVDVLYND